MSAINDALRRASSAAKSGPPDAQASSGPPPLPPMPLPLPPLPIASVSTALPPRIDGTGSQTAPPPLELEASSDITPAPRPRRSPLPFIFAALALLCAAGAAGSFLYAKQRGPLLAKYSAFNQSAAEEGEEGDATETESETPDKSITPAAGVSTEPTVAPTDSKSTPTPGAATQPVAAPTTPARTPIAAVVQPQPQPQPAVVHNPGPPVQFPPLRLQSIYYRPTEPSVMINGKTLFVSDEISGVKVVDISPSSVTLVLSGRTNVLTLR